MSKLKKVKSVKVIRAGSNPDVDSDFNTVSREKVLQYVTEQYGEHNVSNIVTFGTLAAKAAFKSMCTIYNVPFAQANRITSLIPAPIEGVEVKLSDIFNPNSDRYDECADFRAAVAGKEWEKIVKGARAIEGRNKSTGVHACFAPNTLITTLQGYKRIDKVKKGDYVLTHTNSYKEVVETMINDEGTLFRVSGANFLPTEVTGNHPVYVRTIKRENNETSKLSAPAWKKVKDLVIGEDLIGIPVNTDSKIPDNALNLPYEDPDFWWIVGRFVADGWCEDFTSTRNRKKKNDKTYEYERQEKNIVISVGYNDPTLNQLVQKINKLFNCRISPSRTTNKIYITQNNDLFTYLKTFGKDVQNRVVPNDVISLPNILLKEFVEGYLSADSYFNDKTQSYTFSAVSKPLVLSMIAVVNKVYKTHCSVTVEKRSKMIVENREVQCQDKYNLSFKENVINKQQSFYKDNYIWAELKEVEKSDKKIKTYNFSVIDDNSYVANGFVAHNCGVIVSAKPLDEIIPLQVRQTDQKVITQWIYQECEDLGLIKMDFLGLDTVDLIQHTVEYIIKGGKTPPNMLELIHGKMDDPETYKLFQRAETIGIFQFGSEMVRSLLKLIVPESFFDLVVTTAVARPGPMNMKSHIKYADRKNGREDVDYIHPEFKGSALETILKDTQGLCVFQEQIMRISNQIAGMTLQEGDKLRKAMGKKKMDVMMAMRPKFFEGAEKNGFSEEAITILWNTIAEFARYGFNKSHSVAYAMNAYQSAWLKTHYPVEFMAALIAQNVDDKDKTLIYLREASRMRIKVETVDINKSDVKVAPDYSKQNEKRIIFGLSGVKAVSETMAKLIVQEREENGPYKSVQDVIKRCQSRGVSNKRIFENLAYAGAFDKLHGNRHSVIEYIPNLMNDAKKTENLGGSLFDAFEVESDIDDIVQLQEFDYVERLKHEADVIGLYLTGHPLDRIPKEMKQTSILSLLKGSQRVKTRMFVSLTSIRVKQSKRGKSILVDIDDGTGTISARLSKEIVAAIDKKNAQNSIKALYCSGSNQVPKSVEKNLDVPYTPMDSLETNSVYSIELTFKPETENSSYLARISDIRPVKLSQDGTLPIRVRFHVTKDNKNRMRKLYKLLPATLAKKYPGNSYIHVAFYTDDYFSDYTEKNDMYYQAALNEMKNNPTELKERNWPPTLKETIDTSGSEISQSEVFENLDYKDSGFKAEKNAQVESILEKYVGYESYDFGLFNKESNEKYE